MKSRRSARFKNKKQFITITKSRMVIIYSACEYCDVNFTFDQGNGKVLDTAEQSLTSNFFCIFLENYVSLTYDSLENFYIHTSLR